MKKTYIACLKKSEEVKASTTNQNRVVIADIPQDCLQDADDALSEKLDRVLVTKSQGSAELKDVDHPWVVDWAALRLLPVGRR